jgi:hypothetical protein
VIEYRSNTFNGALKGKLLVCRYSNHDDIVVLEPGADGNVAAEKAYTDCVNGVPGLGGFADPLDVVEDPLTGNLYVSEFSEWKSALAGISLCRVPPPGCACRTWTASRPDDEATFRRFRTATPAGHAHQREPRRRDVCASTTRAWACSASTPPAVNPGAFRIGELNGKA